MTTGRQKFNEGKLNDWLRGFDLLLDLRGGSFVRWEWLIVCDIVNPYLLRFFRYGLKPGAGPTRPQALNTAWPNNCWPDAKIA